MARPGLRNHPKFRRLRKLLGMPAVYVEAHLEAMWKVGYENGDPLIGDADDVELAAEWEDSQRPAGEFFKAALDCRWIDQIDGGRFVIHDLLDHAPDYVKKRASRHSARRNKDLRPETADNGGQRIPIPSRQSGSGRTPAPAPAPAPKKGNAAHSSPATASTPTSGVPASKSTNYPLFPCIPGKKSRDETWTLTDALVAELSATFPGVDVPGECRKAHGWVRANLDRRKTAKRMQHFLWSWMERCQNRGGHSPSHIGRGADDLDPGDAAMLARLHGDEPEDRR